ncbi:MAG TPA: helix-turn-helix domain-containing protein [Kofleriaceae bacterium]|nr:helix-turn-helix domain-containing protein [Kofleriaceae bacterium]
MPSPTKLARIDLADLQAATAVLHGRWKTTILFYLAAEPLRFGALRRAIGTISEKVLIQQLRELERDRVVSRHVEATVPPRVEYALTPHGRTLCDVVESMAGWGRKHRRHLERA